MGDSSEPRSPIGVAFEWVARITSVALVMVLPGVAGGWLDHRWGTNWLALLGFTLGLVGGLVSLIGMTKRKGRSS